MINSIRDFVKLLSSSQKKHFFYLQILILLMAILETVSVFSIAPFIYLISSSQTIIENNFVNTLIVFFDINNHKTLIISSGIIILIIFFISTLVSIYTLNKLLLFGYECSSKFSVQLYKYYLSNDWKFHTKSNSSKLIKNISQECDRVSDGIVRQLLIINARIITAVFIIIGLIIYNYILALISFIIFFSSYYLIYYFAKKRLSFHGQNITEKQTERYNILSESFGSVRDIILFDTVKKKSEIFENYSENLAKSRGISAVITIVPKNLIEFIAFSLIILITISLFLFYSGDFSLILSLVSVFGLSSLKILPAFQSVYLCISILRNNISALDTIKNDLFNSQVNINENNVYKGNNKIDFNSKIIFKNISFKYDFNNIIFENLNIEINKNDKIGIIGNTGIGKSTFLNILCGLLYPDTGNIFIDNKELKKENIKKWHKKISLAEQNVFISDSSLISNIVLGEDNEEINYNHFSKVIKIAELEDFVLNLTDGYNTNLGEKGVLISAGQKQRIGIARALYRNPDLLILDEATNALDFEIEEKIYKNIFKEYTNKSIIIISHRTESLNKCNKLYKIENKNISLIS